MTDYERWADLSDREAIGEALSAADREFLERFVSEDERARAERTFWNELENLDASADEASTRIALRAVAAVSKKTTGRSRTWVYVTGGVLAAAAAAALLISSRTAPSARATALLELSLGEVRVAGAPVTQGGLIEIGSDVSVAGGPACVRLEPKMHACFRDGTIAKLTSIGAANRRVDLVSGRVDVALAPLAAGEHFSVVANGVWSTAVGTAFSVEVLANGAVETIVHEGKVRVGAESSGDLVTAHKIGLSQGTRAVEDLRDHRRTETPDWKALGQVAERSIESPIAEAPEAPPSASEAPIDSEPSAKHVVSSADTAPRPAQKAAEAPTAAELLAQARQALREKRWSDAAASYRSIVSTYPSSPEAHTVLVPLANLEVDRLGQAAQGLKHLDAYLATGGPLDVEARLAKIRAFRSLGRSSDEAQAIDEFLSAHPKSLEADSLRERRRSLGE